MAADPPLAPAASARAVPVQTPVWRTQRKPLNHNTIRRNARIGGAATVSRVMPVRSGLSGPVEDQEQYGAQGKEAGADQDGFRFVRREGVAGEYGERDAAGDAGEQENGSYRIHGFPGTGQRTLRGRTSLSPLRDQAGASEDEATARPT